jgi:hypothetical protein
MPRAAFDAGSEAELKVVFRTVEGDPVTEYYRVTSAPLRPPQASRSPRERAHGVLVGGAVSRTAGVVKSVRRTRQKNDAFPVRLLHVTPRREPLHLKWPVRAGDCVRETWPQVGKPGAWACERVPATYDASDPVKARTTSRSPSVTSAGDNCVRSVHRCRTGS